MSAAPRPPGRGLRRAGVADTLAVVSEVIAPTLAKGVLIRRPSAMRLAQRLDLDARAIRRLQALRRTYGDGPLLLAIPGRRHAVLLSPADVQRALDGTPEPFSPATAEKRSALGHFEPDVALVSAGPARAVRRRLNDDVLQSACPVHALADVAGRAMAAEMGELLADDTRTLDWPAFDAAWHRAVRRFVLGEAARDDHDLTEMLAALRRAGNWAFLHPGRPGLRRRFRERLAAHLARRAPDSLAGLLGAWCDRAGVEIAETAAPNDQVAHWLFAFEPGAMATVRALALIAAHPDAAQPARDADKARRGRFLRACMRESVRLWPTTPAILRETTRDVAWDDGVLPARTSVLVFTPFFHRDDETQPDAHRFAPGPWEAADQAPEAGVPPGLVPFSAGPGTCPAHHLVPLMGSFALGAILATHAVALAPPDGLDPARPLPATLDHVGLTFRCTRHTARSDAPALTGASG